MFKSQPKIEADVKYVLFADNVNTVRIGAFGNCNLLLGRTLLLKAFFSLAQTKPTYLILEDDFTVWIDGSQIIKPIKVFSELVEPYTKSVDIATFKHQLGIVFTKRLKRVND